MRKNSFLSGSISALFVVWLAIASSCSQPVQYYANPVIAGDIADPSIIRIGENYYATGTSSEWAPFYPMFTSTDLINWTPTGYIFEKQPEWTLSSFWAPELFYHDNKVFCYYTARRNSDGVSYIGVASASSPTEEFTDHGLLIEFGTEAIDAFVFDDNGQLYITWKAYGLDARPIEIVGSKLSRDGLSLEGEVFSLLVDDENIGMEGQHHFKQDDYYYMIYSTHGCCGPNSDYQVAVARSKSFKGPYEKYEENPILYGGDDFLSCGHGTAVTTPDGRMFYLFHAYLKDEGFFQGRQPILQEIKVNEAGWVYFPTGKKAIKTQQVPFPGTIQQPASNLEDDFDGEKLRPEWTWNYPFSEIWHELKDSKLFLSGIPKENNAYGTVLCLRPLAPDYSCETEVAVSNASVKGLTIYGDSKHLAFLAYSNDEVQLKLVKNGVEELIYSSISDSETVFLKMEITKGCFCKFLWSADGSDWVTVNEEAMDLRQLVRWDRIMRPGLIHIGDPDIPAEFAYFRVQ